MLVVEVFSMSLNRIAITMLAIGLLVMALPAALSGHVVSSGLIDEFVRVRCGADYPMLTLLHQGHLGLLDALFPTSIVNSLVAAMPIGSWEELDALLDQAPASEVDRDFSMLLLGLIADLDGDWPIDGRDIEPSASFCPGIGNTTHPIALFYGFDPLLFFDSMEDLLGFTPVRKNLISDDLDDLLLMEIMFGLGKTFEVFSRLQDRPFHVAVSWSWLLDVVGSDITSIQAIALGLFYDLAGEWPWPCEPGTASLPLQFQAPYLDVTYSWRGDNSGTEVRYRVSVTVWNDGSGTVEDVYCWVGLDAGGNHVWDDADRTISSIAAGASRTVTFYLDSRVTPTRVLVVVRAYGHEIERQSEPIYPSQW